MMVSWGDRDLLLDDAEQQVFRLHGDAYADPAIFEREMALLFEGSWIFLAHESQIPEPNDYLTLNIGRQPVIVARSEGGEIVAFLNRCRHRGAVVCREESGNSARFRCLYHGWTYKNTGKLVGITDRVGYPPEFDLGSLGLTPVPHVRNYRGMIFGSLNPESPSLEDHLGPAKPYLDLILDKYDDGIELARGATRYGFSGNWKLQIENAMDFYHLPVVHKSYFEVLEAKGMPINTETLMHRLREAKAVYLGNGHGTAVSAGASLTDSHDGPTRLMKARLGPEKAEWATGLHQHLFIAPNLVILEQPAPQFRVVRPLAVDQTEVIGYAFFDVGRADAGREAMLRIYEGFYGPSGLGTPDDIAVFNACTTGYRAEASPWNDLSRGLHREATELDLTAVGPFELAGHITDDTVYRGLYRWWAETLFEQPETATATPGSGRGQSR